MVSARHKKTVALALGCLLILSACGLSQEADFATRTGRTVVTPTSTALPAPAIRTADDAIRIARAAVSPYMSTWQDVIATEDHGVWRVIFRGYYPNPNNDPPNGDYYRTPLSVYIDAATGIVLRQEYL